MNVTNRILIFLGFITLIVAAVFIGVSVNVSAMERYYTTILIASLTALVLLSLALIAILAWLIRRRWRREYGSLLTTRLALILAVTGILPGLLIYTLSFQLVSKSIESWFDLPLEQALKSGLTVSQNLIKQNLQLLLEKGAAITSNDFNELFVKENLVELSQRSGLRTISIFDNKGNLIVSNAPELAPPLRSLELSQASRGFAGVLADTVGQEGAPQQEFRIKAVQTFPDQPDFILQIDQELSDQLGGNVQLIEETYSQYKTRNLARDNLISLFRLNLTIIMLLVCVGVISGAVYLSREFSTPLLHLAEGVQLIAAGQYKPRPIKASPDELGNLITAFESMTHRLQAARADVKRNQSEVESAKAYLELVLANMSAGVVVLDDQFRLLQCNHSAKEILHANLDEILGQPLHTLENLKTLSDGIEEGFSGEDILLHSHDRHEWQRQFDIPSLEKDVAVWVRGSSLQLANERHFIVVFDDMTHSISVQRMSAWGDIAKRLAHEIRNPLTPIQLSAERMIYKISPHLAPPEAKILMRSAETITQQVAALKKLVDDFRNFADVQPMEKNPIDLNRLIESVVELYQSDQTQITLGLHESLPLVLADDGQVRQILHNLIKNAIEAAPNPTKKSPVHITLITNSVKLIDIRQRGVRGVQLQVVDNCGGVPAHILPKVFDPYITSKTKGTGLGMAVVKKIIDDHQAKIEIKNKIAENGLSTGAIVSILFSRTVPRPVAQNTQTTLIG